MIKKLMASLVWTLLWVILGVVLIALAIILYCNGKWLGGVIDLGLSIISLFWIVVSIGDVIRTAKDMEITIKFLKSNIETLADTSRDNLRIFAEKLKDNSFEIDTKEYGKIAVVAENTIDELLEDTENNR